MVTDDGTELYFEVDEAGAYGAAEGDGAGGPITAPVSVATGPARHNRR